MKKRLPKISVIIPIKPDGECENCLKALKKVIYPPKNIEVLVSYGTCPSKQRNEAVKKAKGEILYFLDNDSEIEPEALRISTSTFTAQRIPYKSYHLRGFSLLPQEISNFIIRRFFSGRIYKGEIGAVGGPNIWRKEENFWATVAGFTFESFFVHYQMAARYRPIGRVHRASEKELILCNLAVKRYVFNEVKGFSEILYPNEENEFLNRVEEAGYQIVYHPGIIVFRPHRQILSNLLKAFLYYGRGRMEQIKVEGLWQSLPVLTPVFLLAYLAGIIVSILFFGIYNNILVLLIPFILYLITALFSALGFSLRKKKVYLAIFLPIFFLFIHLTYATGLLYGMWTNLRKRKMRAGKEVVKVVKIKSFGDRWGEING